PESDIVVSAGSTGAFYCACLALLNPGDEVIVFEPFYWYHVQTLIALEVVPALVALRPPDWSFTVEDVQRAITPRTRAIVINTPSNPCGKVFTTRELQLIADIAIDEELIVLTDEVYEYFI